jgi:tetratricopeptide (TPR) repeat protein
MRFLGKSVNDDSEEGVVKMKDLKAIVILLVVALGVCIMIVGCGATPEPEPTPTPVVLAVTPTPLPPTPTPVPPTPTPLPMPTEEVSRSYEEYISDEMGFSLTYPEGWVVQEGDTPDEGVYFGPSGKLSAFLWIGLGEAAGQEAIQVQKDFNEEQGYENLLYGDISKERWFGLSVLHLGYEYDNQEEEHILGAIYAWTTDAGYNYTAVMELPDSDEAAYEEIKLAWESIELTTPTAALPVPTAPPPTATSVPAPPTPVPAPAVSPAQEHVQKGLEYGNQDKWDEALAEFQEAVRLDPQFGRAYWGLGYSYLAKGELGKAIEALEKYLQLEPDASDRAEVEAMIQQMRDILGRASVGGPCCQPMQAGKGAIWFENHIGETVFADVGPNYYEIPGKQGDAAGCLCPQLDAGHYTLILHTGWGDARGDIDIVAGQTLHQAIQ